METGSLVNMMYGNSIPAEPVVGMGVTFLSWTDRSPGTIVQIDKRGGKIELWVTGDTAVRTDDYGMSETQVYEYTSNYDAQRILLKQDKLGVWRVARETPTGQMRVNKDCQRVAIGIREKYHDFSF